MKTYQVNFCEVSKGYFVYEMTTADWGRDERALRAAQKAYAAVHKLAVDSADYTDMTT